MDNSPYYQLFKKQQQQQQQNQSKPFMNFVPIEIPVANPIPFFHSTSIPDQPPASCKFRLLRSLDFYRNPSFLFLFFCTIQTDGLLYQIPNNDDVHVAGIAPSADCEAEVWEPRRKKVAREREFLENSSQLSSSIGFLRAGDSVVSTGLGLSLNDRDVTAAALSSVGDLRHLSLLLNPSFIDEEIAGEIQRQDAEMDQFIKIQSERLRQQILEKVQAKQIQTLAYAQDKFLCMIREKEAEVDDMNRRNAELEEHLKQLTSEVAAWQHRAKFNENMISALQQAYAQAQENHRRNKNNTTGDDYGSSEVEDAASCCGGGDLNLRLASEENKDMELMTCKVCKSKEACMLLLPCRHLCVCKECEAKLSFCPICRDSKLFGSEIYID